MKYFYWATCFFLLLPYVYPEIIVTEVMFNPNKSNEWVEFFNNGGKANLSGIYFEDNYQSDPLVCCFEECVLEAPEKDYFLVLEKDNLLNHSNTTFFCVDDNNLGNGLGNGGDEIKLVTGPEIHTNFVYNVSVGTGNTLGLLNGTWLENEPTPGRDNLPLESGKEDNFQHGIEIVIGDGPLITNIKYSSLAELHNLDYPSSLENINVTGEFNLTFLSENMKVLLYSGEINSSFKHTKQIEGDFFFENPGDYLFCSVVFSNYENETLCKNLTVIDSKSIPCNVSLSVKAEGVFFYENDSIGFENELSNTTFGYEIEYWVEDLFGNEMKERQKTSNQNKKHFSPEFDEEDRAFLIKANLTRTYCNNTGNTTFSESLVIVKSEYRQESKSNVSIINPTSYENETEFGAFFDIDLKIYKGNTRKSLVEIYLKGSEKISYVTDVKVNTKFSEIDLTLPVRIKENCDKKYREGTYSLVIEGLDTYSENPIYVNYNSGCKAEDKKKAPESSTLKPSFQETQTKENTYELVSLLQDVFSSEIIATMKIYNGEKRPHNYSIWSYSYKGSTSYSGNREANMVNFTLGAFSEETVILRSKLSKTPPEKFMHKIKILRGDRKTPYEITENLTFSGKNITGEKNISLITQKEELPLPIFYNKEDEIEEDTATQTGNKEIEEISQNNRITGAVIYESKTEKLKRNLIFFVIVALVFGAISFLGLRKKRL